MRLLVLGVIAAPQLDRLRRLPLPTTAAADRARAGEDRWRLDDAADHADPGRTDRSVRMSAISSPVRRGEISSESRRLDASGEKLFACLHRRLSHGTFCQQEDADA